MARALLLMLLLLSNLTLLTAQTEDYDDSDDNATSDYTTSEYTTSVPSTGTPPYSCPKNNAAYVVIPFAVMLVVGLFIWFIKYIKRRRELAAKEEDIESGPGEDRKPMSNLCSAFNSFWMNLVSEVYMFMRPKTGRDTGDNGGDGNTDNRRLPVHETAKKPRIVSAKLDFSVVINMETVPDAETPGKHETTIKNPQKRNIDGD